MTQTGQHAEPAAVHISVGPHMQEDGDEGCDEETPLCRRPGPGGEWQTGATGDTGGVERLPKIAAELREQGRRRRGRPMLKLEDCVKRDMRKAGEEEDWKKKTRDKGGWKIL